MTQLWKGFGQRIKALGTEQVLGKLEFLSMSTWLAIAIWKAIQYGMNICAPRAKEWHRSWPGLRDAKWKRGQKKKKKWKRRRQRKREESSLQSLSFLLAFFTSRRSLLSEGLEQVRARKQPTFRDATTDFPRNDVWQTSAEIPFWWRDSTKG